MAKTEKLELLKNMEILGIHFNICWTLPISAQLSLVNFFEKMGGTLPYRSGRKIGRNHGRTHLRL